MFNESQISYQSILLFFNLQQTIHRSYTLCVSEHSLGYLNVYIDENDNLDANIFVTIEVCYVFLDIMPDQIIFVADCTSWENMLRR